MIISPEALELIGECLVHEVWMLEETISALEYLKQEHLESFNAARDEELQNSITKMSQIETLLPTISSTWTENLAAWRLFIDNVEYGVSPPEIELELGNDVW